MRKKALALLLFFSIAFSCIPFNAIIAYAESDRTTISVVNKYGAAGSTVVVSLGISNNPGISGAKISVSYDEKLTLVDSSNDGVFASLDFTKPGAYQSPCNFNWDSESVEVTEDGSFLTLKFEVSDEVEADEKLPINISYRSGDIYDGDINTVEANIENGYIQIINFTPGDVNEDGSVNGKDVTLVRRYNAGGYDVIINYSAADVNDDDLINGKDVTIIRRYNAGGYNVKLLPHTTRCVHDLTATKEIAATCSTDGNIQYWHCSICDKYYSDADAQYEIQAEDTIVKAFGHEIVIDEAIPATKTSEGLTQGSHCARCKEIIVKQDTIPVITGVSITYDISNGDIYLAQQSITNNNPCQYYTDEGVSSLKAVSCPGYQFLGWYDLPAGNNAVNVKSIPAGSTDEKILYAHWQKLEYSIEFTSSLIPVSSINYTVDKDVNLPTPVLDGYIFTGWSDGEGNIIKVLPKGNVGNKIYTANWLSERNKAWTKDKLDDPIIVEDEETGNILFTYEIGRIENIPLYEIENFGYINSEGVARTISKTYTVQTSKTLMEQYADTVANSTTNSSQWSLSNGWNDSITVNENWLEENEIDIEDAKTLCTTDEENWLVSSGSYGSTTTNTYESAQEYDLHTTTGNTKTYDTDTYTHGNKFNAELDLSYKKSIEASAKVISGKVEYGAELDLAYEQAQSHAEKTGTETDTGNNDQTGSVTHTGTDTTEVGGWNTSSSYGGSNSVTKSSSTMQAISNKIASEYGYGKSYIKTGDETSTQGTTTSASNSKSYTSAVTYNTAETVTESITYTTANTKTGYHRLVKAGTAHVFAIVGYDIRTAMYYVTTFSVMDDEMHDFEDYSYRTALYDDCQTSVISFEIPYDVEEYVLSKIGETEGLEFNSAGIVTNYTGTEKTVFIPEYHAVDNLDGTKSVIKVIGIAQNAFKGNTNITGVSLSDYITEIPDNAFEGCSSLSFIDMPGVSTIGKEAFKGCTTLGDIYISSAITSLGENVFDGFTNVIVYTDKMSVIDAAVKSGSENIYLYLTGSIDNENREEIVVTSDTNIFVLNGCGYDISNIYISSDAARTVINNINLNSNNGTIVETSSQYLQLGTTKIQSNVFPIVMKNDNCQVELYGENKVLSESDYAILCKNISLIKTAEATKNGVYSELEVNGDVYCCGTVEGSSMLKLNGEIKTIDETAFNGYLDKHTITFNAGEGSVSKENAEIYFGQNYDILPTPTRENYDFIGWFTEETDGERIISESVFDKINDITLYAHWSLKVFTVSFNANGGSVSTTSINATCDTALGSLPKPTKDYYTFNGWFTEAEGGTQVTNQSKYSEAKDITLYAHWTLNPVSNWVLSSNMPSGATVISAKYTYTHRYYTTNSASSLSGWTKYNTVRTSWGSTNGPVYSNPANGSRNVWSEQYVVSTNYKTVYHYNRSISGTGSGAYSTYDTDYYATYQEIALDYALTKLTTVDGHAQYGKYKYGSYANTLWWNQWTTSEVASYNYGTRWYYQEPIYTYYYYRDANEESTSCPSGSDYSNIQHWVQYRAK